MEDGHDFPPPEYAEPVGSDCYITRWTCYEGTAWNGVIVWHPAPDGTRCAVGVPWDHCGPNDDRPLWTLESRDPLTLTPSIVCLRCQWHHHIINGQVA